MKKLLIFATLSVFALAITACKKPGCDDETALNYSKKANTNDGSCIYEGTAVFYFKDSTSIHLNDAGITELKFFVDSQLIGTKFSFEYWIGDPDCGQAVTFIKSMKEPETNYYYHVHDQNGLDVWNGTLTTVGDECVLMEMVY